MGWICPRREPGGIRFRGAAKARGASFGRELNIRTQAQFTLDSAAARGPPFRPDENRAIGRQH